MARRSTTSTGQPSAAELRRANRALRLHSALFREIALAEDEQSLCERACRLLVDAGGYACAWVGRAEHDDRRTVRWIAGAGQGAEEVATFDIRWSEVPEGSGVTGRAIRSRQPEVFKGKYTGHEPWSSFGARRGMGMAVSLPLIVDGDVFGALSLYTPEPDSFGDTELEPLVDFAAGVSLAIAQLRARAAQRRVERSLAQSEARLSDVLARVQDVVYAYDQYHERFLYISPAVERLFGRPPTRYQAGHFRQDVHPDDLPRIAAIHRRLMEGENVDDEFRIVRPDGEVRWVRHRAFAVRGAHGAVDRFDGIFTDVTDRRRAEDALRRSEEQLWQSEEQLRKVVDNVDEAVFIVDVATQNVLYASAALAKLRGWSLGDGQGASVADWIANVHPEDREGVVHTIQRCFAGEVAGISYRVAHPDGSILRVAGTGIPVRGPHGELSRLVGVVRDVTEKVDAQSAWEQQIAALRAENALLTRERKARDEFLAGMSHDLRIPLNVVLGLSEALLEDVYGGLTERQRGTVTRVGQSARHLGEMLEDILVLTRLEADDLTLAVEDVSVEDACRAAARLVQTAAEKKRQALAIALSAHGVTIAADPRRLKQMLVNLLSNAVKFTPEGGDIGLAATVDPSGEAVRITVWDRGIGIAPDDIARLFEPFAQIDPGKERRVGGTGLGLALVRRLAELHGGRLLVESELGVGSRFALALPVRLGGRVADA